MSKTTKIIRVYKVPYMIFSAPFMFLIALFSDIYFSEGHQSQAAGIVLVLVILYALLALHLACTRIEIDEDSIKCVNLWHSRKMRLSEVLGATTEFGERHYADRFKMRGLIQLIIAGKDSTELVINMKLFPKKEMHWLLAFATELGRTNRLDLR